MKLIAHRGLATEYIKENTIEAFLNAVDNGYDGIELDIRLTKDNKIVVLHDKLINRTSNGKGDINNFNYKDLLRYNFGTDKVKSKIPLLADVIKRINNKVVIIELKEKIEKGKLKSILDSNQSNDYYISSFYKDYIDNIKGIKFKTGLINYIFNSNININDYDFILVLESLFTKNIYDYLNSINIEPIIYGTLNNIKLKNKEIINNIKYIV